MTTTSSERKQRTPAVRRELLATELAAHIRRGWRVESQSEYLVAVVKGRRANHVLHLLISVFTVGLWIPLWVIMALSGGETRKTIQVDEWYVPAPTAAPQSTEDPLVRWFKETFSARKRPR